MVVGTQPLEDAVPEGDQRSKGPLIKLLVHPGSQESGWQKLVETAQELGGAKTGAEQLRSLGFGRFGFLAGGRQRLAFGRLSFGFGFRVAMYVCIMIYIHI